MNDIIIVTDPSRHQPTQIEKNAIILNASIGRKSQVFFMHKYSFKQENKNKPLNPLTKHTTSYHYIIFECRLRDILGLRGGSPIDILF